MIQHEATKGNVSWTYPALIIIALNTIESTTAIPTLTAFLRPGPANTTAHNIGLKANKPLLVKSDSIPSDKATKPDKIQAHNVYNAAQREPTTSARKINKPDKISL